MKNLFGSFLARKQLICLLGLCTLIGVSGCARILADDMKYFLPFESSRNDLLQERVKLWGRALYWRDVEASLAMVDPLKRTVMAPELQRRKKDEKVVDVEVENMELVDGISKAKVALRVRYYRVPAFTVEDRVDHLQWAYAITEGGWFLNGWQDEKNNEEAVEIGNGRNSVVQ